MLDFKTAVALAAALCVVGAAASAAEGQASPKNCYEDIGCPWKDEAKLPILRKLSCQNLAQVRNQLYHENGYCFRTAAAKAQYGNAGCKYPLTNFVPLNATERANIARIRKVEREKGCV